MSEPGAVVSTSARTSKALPSTPTIQNSSAFSSAPLLQQVAAPVFAAQSSSTITLEPPQTSSDMSWKEQGDFHLKRNELKMAEGAYSKALEKALKENKNVATACKDMGFFYFTYEKTAAIPWHKRSKLDDEKWTLAAKFLAIARFQHQNETPRNDNAIKLVETYQTELEKAFFDKEWGVLPNTLSAEAYSKQRAHLKYLRQSMGEKIKRNPTELVLREFSDHISKFVYQILEEPYSIIGPPPSEAEQPEILFLGSLGREEMCPFSDFEFAVFANKSWYLRKLMKWLEIRVIFLEETNITGLYIEGKPLIKKGFSFDEGGNVPLGKAELIGTPEELAANQSETAFIEDRILSNVLKDGSILGTKSTRYPEYRRLVQTHLKTASNEDSKRNTGQWRALTLMREHLADFKPQTKETPLFDIKAELYRLPSFLVSCLAYYFDIDAQNTWDKIAALVHKRFLSEEGGANLIKILNFVLNLRIRCHLHYGEECELAYHPKLVRDRNKFSKTAFILSDNDVAQIENIFLTLRELQNVFKNFASGRNKYVEALARQSFSPLSFNMDTPIKRGKQETVLLCRQKLSVNPDNVQEIFNLIQTLCGLKQFIEAEQYIEKFLALPREKQNSEIADRLLNFQGEIAKGLGRPQEALEHFKSSFIMCHLSESFSDDTILQLQKLCLHCLDIKKFAEAKEHAKELQSMDGGNNAHLVQFFLGEFFEQLSFHGEFRQQEALDWYKKAVENAEKIAPEYSTLWFCRRLQAVGRIYAHFRDSEKVNEYYLKAAKIIETYHHPYFFTLGDIYREWAQSLLLCGVDNEEVLKILDRAVDIYETNYKGGKRFNMDVFKERYLKHESSLRDDIETWFEHDEIKHEMFIGMCYTALKRCSFACGNRQNAREYFKQVVEGGTSDNKEFRNTGSSKSKNIWEHIHQGELLSRTQEYEKARECFTAAVKLAKQYGNYFADLIPALEYLESVEMLLDHPQEAIQAFELAKKYEQPKFSIERCKFISIAYKGLKQHGKAKEYLGSVIEQSKNLGRETRATAEIYYILSLVHAATIDTIDFSGKTVSQIKEEIGKILLQSHVSILMSCKIYKKDNKAKQEYQKVKTQLQKIEYAMKMLKREI